MYLGYFMGKLRVCGEISSIPPFPLCDTLLAIWYCYQSFLQSMLSELNSTLHKLTSNCTIVHTFWSNFKHLSKIGTMYTCTTSNMYNCTCMHQEKIMKMENSLLAIFGNLVRGLGPDF